jgi:hypothetical protein
MPAVSKPYVPYAGFVFVPLDATAGVAAGIEVDVVVDADCSGVGVVWLGADFDPHAAMNKVAASSFDFMPEVLTRTPLAR